MQEALPLLNDQPLSSPLNSELFQPITIPVTTLSKHNVKKEREGEGERERERDEVKPKSFMIAAVYYTTFIGKKRRGRSS